MRIKKFSAATMKAGKALIIKELGEDAVILSSRTIQSSASGAEMVEIVAAIDDRPAASRPPSRKTLESQPLADFNKERPEAKEALSTINPKIYSELLNIKESISEIADSVRYKFAPALGGTWAKLYKTFIDLDFSEDFSLQNIGKIASHNPFTDYGEALREARKMVANQVNLFPTIEPKAERQIFAFVGTAGCGKTSALIKLAVICKLLHQSEILIVSTDTYKVGGAEQLQTFSSIASIPFKAVYSMEELKTLIDKEIDKSMIFIDTTGKSQNDTENMDSLKEFMGACAPNVKFLVQSACSSFRSITDSIEKFSELNIDSMILTNVDSTPCIGQAIEAVIRTGMPLAYFTNGQHVPESIEPVSPKNIADFTFSSLGDEAI